MSAMVGPRPNFFKSRAIRQGIFFFCCQLSPTEGFFRRQAPTPYILHTYFIHTYIHTNNFLPLPLLRPNTWLGRPFSRACHGPFSLGVGIISLPWFQNTIISGKAYIRTLRSTHVPPISHFFFKFSFDRWKWYTLHHTQGCLTARLPRYISTHAPLCLLLLLSTTFCGEFKC